MWVKRPAQLITAEELQLYRRAKALFTASRQSLGSRELMKYNYSLPENFKVKFQFVPIPKLAKLPLLLVKREYKWF